VKKTGDQRIPLAAPDRQPVMVGVRRRRQGIGAQGRLRLTRDRHADRQKLPGNLPVERFAVDAAQIEEADDLAFGLDLEDFELDIGVALAVRDDGRVGQQGIVREISGAVATAAAGISAAARRSPR
jgi:hypothetical protein